MSFISIEHSHFNKFNLHQLIEKTIHRGLKTMKNKYELIIQLIQWWESISYNYFPLVHGYVVSERGPRTHMEDSYIVDIYNTITIYGVLMVMGEIIYLIYYHHYVKQKYYQELIII